MQLGLWFGLFAVAAAPLVSANYGSRGSGAGGQIQYLPGGPSAGLEEYVNVATGGNQPSANQLTAQAEIQPSPQEARRLGRVQAQLHALNNSPTYQKLKNSEDIAESLAETNLASNIRQGKINVVSPQFVDQHLFRSLLVPSGHNNHQVIATQPLPPIIVHQPGAPPAHVNSGPPTVVRGNPVIYKIKPSVIYQQEVINKVPTPLSLNPVYVKVYKPGKKIEAPMAPVVAPVYQQPQHYSQPQAYGSSAASSSVVSGHSSDSYGSGADSSLYASPAPYGSPNY
ncbi:chorion protein S36 [Drosophila grimshawi]|uniref:GH12240 n=1 Tax=Drosophila grimshawi TaxID=7222 RepID=B4JJJ9_DROGR|nr:chorion protein S36 [Drosophila grimshawi]EDV99751.1 GH12240 [Drosophila grimshawi]